MAGLESSGDKATVCHSEAEAEVEEGGEEGAVEEEVTIFL